MTATFTRDIYPVDYKPPTTTIINPRPEDIPVWTANDSQIADSFYKDMAIQPWDYITKNNFSFLEGCIIKYVSTYKDKDGVQDLRKAQHFLQKLVEVTEEREN